MNTGVNGSNGQSHAADLHVQEVIRSAERELHELLERRAELMKRIGTIKQTLAGLANIFGDCVLSDQLLTFLDRKSSSRQPGFTRACRVVLMEAKKATWRPPGMCGIAAKISGGAGASQRPYRLGDHGVKPPRGLHRSPVFAGCQWTSGVGMDRRTGKQY